MTTSRGVLGVVISYYNARSPDNLHSLVNQLLPEICRTDNSSQSFRTEIIITVNAVENGFRVTVPDPRVHKIVQPNQGFNIGARDHAYRCFPDFDNYLFLQDECEMASPTSLARY